MNANALIVGAGPAGLYAAQLLARRGLAVRVVEAHDQVGEPVHCTGIVGREALALPGVPGNATLSCPGSASFHSPGGHRLAYVGAGDEACIVDRGQFDRALAEAARAAGAEIVTGARAVDLRIGPSAVTVDVRNRDGMRAFAADVCLLACGASYALQRRLGWGIPALFLSSAQTERGAIPAAEIDILFRRELAPLGFAWFVPISRSGSPRAKVGVMAAVGARRVLARLVDELAAAGRISASRDPVVSRLLPLAPLARTFGNRVVAIGDAAGLVKPTTGGGIYYSLLSATWAADTAVAAFDRGDFTARTLGGYEETWRARLGRELRIGVCFRRIAARLTAVDLDALIHLAMHDGVMPIVRASARFNYHQDLIVRTLRHPGILQILLRHFRGAQNGGPKDGSGSGSLPTAPGSRAPISEPTRRP